MIQKTVPPQGDDVEHQFHRLWFSSIDWDSWDDAFMKEVAKYLLEAKGLKIPEGWQWIIPGDLWES